ncbi:hypothetical protein F441_11704 [Phytophthora nicotianae CJ01A1]|uniref:Uncharacterized protein n=2 Tax=Phytophthora nicotianae TaxID=4792 RepID=W2WTW5_PHYNI|nr:hypothetical protein L916_11363 [Phytophthora nicotianae]ETP13019.1 hypothetical protein F441_11704 [Phytophthora nicotianae CJ01A1]
MSVLNEPESVSNDGKHDITLDSVLSLSSDDVDESGGRSGGQLENEGEIKTKVHDETAGETFRATTAPVNTSTAAGSVRRRTRAVASTTELFGHDALLVKLRRRRRRNSEEE